MVIRHAFCVEMRREIKYCTSFYVDTYFIASRILIAKNLQSFSGGGYQIVRKWRLQVAFAGGALQVALCRWRMRVRWGEKLNLSIQAYQMQPDHSVHVHQSQES